MPNPSDTRDRVRALVREVLATVPTEPEDAKPNDKPPEHLIVNSLKDTLNKEWDRDESAKQLITEDDLRGLPAVGAQVDPAGSSPGAPLDLRTMKSAGSTTMRRRSATRPPSRSRSSCVAIVPYVSAG